MQYGDLSGANQALFDTYQAAKVREPTFVVWIESLSSDPTQYIMKIDTEVALESAMGRGHLNIGKAIVEASNEDSLFFAGGESTIEKNARIKIWAGFSDLNIPIFSGVVKSVEPALRGNNVTIICTDYMGLFRELRVSGSQGANNTIELILEDFCSRISASSNIDVTDETGETLTSPSFDPKLMLAAAEECCDSIFSVAYFDEDGTMQIAEREYSNAVSWTFDDDNVLDEGCRLLAPTSIINDVEVEYRENYLAKYKDQASIDLFRSRDRRLRLLLLNSTEVASKTSGATTETIDYDLEGFKFTSAAGVANIDCVSVWLKQDGSSSGAITLKIYSDSGGSPDTLLGTSDARRAKDLGTAFKRLYFNFSTPVAISPATDYWGILDSSSVTGTLYFRISATTATSLHVYDDSGWNLESDKQVMFMARSSLQAQRVAEDVVRFYKEPMDRLRILAPAAPHLQLCDEVLIDVTTPFAVTGRYVITGRQHRFRTDGYITIDTLEKRE